METLEQIQARHRKESKDLQGRITNKKKNATKKTRKGVNDECADLERQLKERHEEELRALNGGNEAASDEERDDAEEPSQNGIDRTVVDADGIATKLADTNLSDPDSPTPSSPATRQQQQQQPPQQGKKRNRQKDRLARRAAEQEAAAIRAEEEAANMVDHRSVEKTYMVNEFKAHALVEKEIQPDGHCLFSAVADQLEQSAIPLGAALGDQPQPQLPYKVVRRAAAGYMQAHGDDFAGFLEEPLDSYVAKIRDTAEWGGQLELLALANTYNVEIHVIQDGRTEVVSPTIEGDEEPKKIWLAYYRHGYGLGEHYNSLRKKS